MLFVQKQDPSLKGLVCKLADLKKWKDEGLFDLFCRKPKVHRKDWEMGFVLSCLLKAGLLRAGKTGIVFGCGNEETVPVLANLGLKITATDQPASAGIDSRWNSSGEFCHGKDSFQETAHKIGNWANIEKNIDFFAVDMNQLDLPCRAHDFLWTSCVIEHLGSLANTFRFVANSMKYLAPGGLAIHTTEYDWLRNRSIDHLENCVFNQKKLTDLSAILAQHGHRMMPIDYSLGQETQDHFVDKHPFRYSLKPPEFGTKSDCGHLKLSVGEKNQTSLGFIVVARHFYMM